MIPNEVINDPIWMIPNGLTCQYIQLYAYTTDHE